MEITIAVIIGMIWLVFSMLFLKNIDRDVGVIRERQKHNERRIESIEIDQKNNSEFQEFVADREKQNLLRIERLENALLQQQFEFQDLNKKFDNFLKMQSDLLGAYSASNERIVNMNYEINTINKNVSELVGSVGVLLMIQKRDDRLM